MNSDFEEFSIRTQAEKNLDQYQNQNFGGFSGSPEIFPLINHLISLHRA